MPLHAGVPGALPDGGVNRERALRFHLGNHITKQSTCIGQSKTAFRMQVFSLPTSGPLNDRPGPATWYPATKDQGLDGGEAPRRSRRMPGRAQKRGAPRRRIKALTGGEAPRLTRVDIRKKVMHGGSRPPRITFLH